MREIVFDTETTGLDPFQGHRLIEIGCIELLNRIPSGQTLPLLRQSGARRAGGGLAIHGISTDQLKDKPLFAEIADELVAFIGDAPLIAHNAMFDLGFLNAELERAGKGLVARERLVDTLLLARRRHPGASNRLDDLCARYGIDNSRRTKHGALLDAELLAEVYLELIGARQAQLGLVETSIPACRGCARRVTVIRMRPQPSRAAADRGRARRASAFIATLRRQRDLAEIRRRPSNTCRRIRAAGQLGGTAGGALLRHALLIERDEIDRIEQQRREAAVAHRRGDDLAGEREQQPRALDHHQRRNVLLRYVLDAEHAGERQVERKQQRAAAVRPCLRA